MTIQLVDPNLIDPNPYQPPTRLTFTADQLADLESVKTLGCLQTPRARPLADGRFQIIYGWRRRCAWLLYRPGEQMPLDVVDATDEQLFDQAAIENGQRADLSAIEKAAIVQRAIAEFNKTQLAAGQLVGLASQGAVSNLLRLLQLPDRARALVHQGDVPERLARQLVPLMASGDSASVTKLATQIAKAKPEDKEATAEHAIGSFFHHENAVYLSDHDWPPDWPGQPIAAKIGDAREPQAVPKCKGCPFSVHHNVNSHCLRPACYRVKCQLWAEHEMQRVAAKLGISAVGPDEKTQIFYSGEYNSRPQEFATKALALKHNSLRLVPFVANDHGYTGTSESLRQKFCGSAAVALATTNMAALKKAVSQIKAPKAKADDWKAKDRERRKQIALHNKAARALITSAAPHLGVIMPESSIVLDLLFRELKWRESQPQDAEKKYKAADLSGKRAMLISILLERSIGIDSYTYTSPDKARRHIEDLAKQLSIKLPATWADDHAAVGAHRDAPSGRKRT